MESAAPVVQVALDATEADRFLAASARREFEEGGGGFAAEGSTVVRAESVEVCVEVVGEAAIVERG
jgi:hypothetical protein